MLIQYGRMERRNLKEPIYHAECLAVNMRGSHEDMLLAAARIFEAEDICQAPQDIIDHDDGRFTILYPLTVSLSHTEAQEVRYLDAMDERLAVLCTPLKVELLGCSFQ